MTHRRILGALALAFGLALSACHFDPAFAQTVAPPSPTPAPAAVQCPEFTYKAAPPAAPGATIALCYHAFVVGYSPTLRDPLWSAEHLTADGAKAAMVAKRTGTFHAETQLAPADRAELADYHCAPFDRGHMTPVGDFGADRDKGETFSLANMVPQAPELNEGLWAEIEAEVRGLAIADGEVWIVTGPAFADPPALLNARVAVPRVTWKAVYDPKLGAWAFVAQNDASGVVAVVSIAELVQLIGFDPFPALDDAAKATPAAVTPLKPRPHPIAPRPCKTGE